MRNAVAHAERTGGEWQARAFVWDRFVGKPELVRKVTPFGGGASMCPGRSFARREIKAFVAATLAKYELELPAHATPPPFDPSRSGLGIFSPNAATPVRVRARAVPPRGAA